MLEKLRLVVNRLGQTLLKVAAPLVVTSIIVSIVSFRQLWTNDVFHVVVLTSLILPLVKSQLARIDYEKSISRSQTDKT